MSTFPRRKNLLYGIYMDIKMSWSLHTYTSLIILHRLSCVFISLCFLEVYAII